jgi:tetratricopeptide (TPR) repeat protein
MSDGQRIDPEKVGSPFQLLAAALVFIVLLDGSFLSAAAVISEPRWASGVLVIASVLNVPVLLFGTFVLQTRFRDELLGDEHYVRLRQEVQWSTLQLKRSNDAAGIDLLADFRFEAQRNVEAGKDLYLSRYGRELERALDDPRRRDALDGDTIASASLELGRASAAGGDWVVAAKYFETSLKADPEAWGSWFALATALANTRGGDDANRRALEAIDEALALAPLPVHDPMFVRMQSYRAALLKRLGKTGQALTQLLAAREYAVEGTYEADDIAYNLACVYAMRDEGEKAMAELGRARDDRFLIAASAHRHDYFASLTGSAAFEALIGDAMTRADHA